MTYDEIDRERREKEMLTEAIAKGTEEGIRRTWTVEQTANFYAQRGRAGLGGIVLIGVISACGYIYHEIGFFWAVNLPNPTLFGCRLGDAVALVVVLLFLRLCYVTTVRIIRWFKG